MEIARSFDPDPIGGPLLQARLHSGSLQMPLKIAIFAAAALIAGTAGAHPKIYTYLDADGIRHYTDVPDNNRYKLLTMSPQDLTESGDRYSPALLARATQYDAIIENAAVSSALEANLLRAVIVVESGFNSRAVSKRGAVGLMQLMPATANRFGVSNLYDPKQNIRAGAQYLKFLMDRFGQNVRLALAAYNAGEEAVDRSGGQIPPFSETMAYVPRVLKVYRMLTEQPRNT
jgi:soluble lytic murein transglycosylase-like protein